MATKALRKKENAKTVWKKDIPVMAEQHIMAEWAHFVFSPPAIGRRRSVGRRQPNTLWNPRGGWQKKEHVLILNDKQWDLYFYQNDNDFDHTVFAARLIEHPFVNNCSFEPLKPKGQWKLANGVQKWFPDDHLSEKDIGFRTNNNVCCLAGYSKNDDGPAVGG